MGDRNDETGAAPLPEDDPSLGVYSIAVAAELVGSGEQNLRAYERRGLLEPDRTPAGTRRYSPDDIARLRRIGALLAEGLNLAGVARVLELEDRNAELRSQVVALRARIRRRTPPPTG